MGLSDKEIISKLFAVESKPSKYPVPDWSKIHQELRSKIVTLELLHEEYRKDYPDGHYGYTWFCNHHKAYAKKLSPSMRQIHKAGEKVFIDFSGVRQAIADPLTGEIAYAEIFVAVLGASGYPFVIAVPSQKKADFIYAHNAMLKDFNGVPELLVPDNLKNAVTRVDRYEPDLNPDYVKLAEHYGTAIMPARGYKPQDKSLVENGVKLMQRWLLARLRHTTFYSIVQLNNKINELMPLYRNKKMKRLGVSRQELFDTIDKPALKPLPANEYEYKELKLLKVSIDYHIQLDYVFYSVPYQLIHKKVEVWFSTKMVSIYFEGKEIATHPRLYKRGAYSIQKVHMSSAHQKYEALQEQLAQSAYSELPFEKLLQLLLESEKTSRDNKKIKRLQNQAKLHEKSASIEEINFTPTRGIHKATLLELAGGGYLQDHRNIILTGATGTGKSFIAQALANKAMIQGHSALYLRIPRLMQLLSSAKGDDEYLKLLAKLKRIKVLILDDFGVSPLKASEAKDLLEIVEGRTNLSSLIITSQLPIKEWHGHLHNPTIADAILDRIIHNAYKINLEGESQRKLKNQK